MKDNIKTIEFAVEVWNIDLLTVGNQLERCRDILTGTERQRASRFVKKEDADRFILCRGLLRRILADYLEQDPSGICFKHNENGKPFLADTTLSFNVSHSRDRLLIAVTSGRSVGVDIEFRRAEIQMDSIAERWFSPAERSFFQCSENPEAVFFEIWSKKEAYVKALGDGIFRDLSSFTVPLSSAPDFPTIGNPEGWFFQTLEIDPAYAAAIVFEAPSVPVHLRTL